MRNVVHRRRRHDGGGGDRRTSRVKCAGSKSVESGVDDEIVVRELDAYFPARGPGWGPEPELQRSGSRREKWEPTESVVWIRI